MPFTKKAARKEYADKSRQFVAGRWWLAPTRAAKYRGVTRKTLQRYAVEGRVETKPLDLGYGRQVDFYSEKSLDADRKAAAKRPRVPTVPGHLHIKDAARQTRDDDRSFRAWLKAKRIKPLKVRGKSKPAKFRRKKGRRSYELPRTYVPTEVVDERKAEKARDPKPADKLTPAEAAGLLDVPVGHIYPLIKLGLLAASDGKAICKGGWVRGGLFITPESVTALKGRWASAWPHPITGADGKVWQARPYWQKFAPHATDHLLRTYANKQLPDELGGHVLHCKLASWLARWNAGEVHKPAMRQDALERLEQFLSKRGADPKPADKMTAREAAPLFGLAPKTVRIYIRRGTLKLTRHYGPAVGEDGEIQPRTLLLSRDEVEKEVKRWAAGGDLPAGNGAPVTQGEQPPSPPPPVTSTQGGGRRGPRRSDRTARMYAACYTGIAEGKTLKEVMVKLKGDFTAPDDSPPTTPRDVSCYARRHAREYGKPWPVPRPGV
jgi:hypothetical protein